MTPRTIAPMNSSTTASDSTHAPAPLRRLDQLPFDNTFARLPDIFHSRLEPWPLTRPRLVAASAQVAELIGLHPDERHHPDFVACFSGNRVPAGAEPLAAVYSGHQFGVWAGQLGDGRAHLLGEVRTPNGSLEIQLKGAGQTPYSRFADGRAVLRSSIREFLCSEAMAALGVPTTRALCITASDDPVQREEEETAAVVTRIAPSFVRFGSFEHWSANDKEAELKVLADYVIDHSLPALRDRPHPYEALLEEASRRTGTLIAHWQAVGFMHGVMNTDNMSILGLTLDYGPFGFMEAFDAGHLCNHSDHHGRYSYRNQPRIGHWNLYALGDALQSLIGHPERARDIVDHAYASAYNERFMALMRAKLGLTQSRPNDEELVSRLYGLLHFGRVDYTHFFRALSRLDDAPLPAERHRHDAPVRDLFADREGLDAWLADWRGRIAVEQRPQASRQQSMLANNPKYILRNWMAEQAIRRSKDKDDSEVERMLDCLRHPFDEQPHYEAYAAAPPEWASALAVSCSS